MAETDDTPAFWRVQNLHEDAGLSWDGYAKVLLGKAALIPQSTAVDAFTAFMIDPKTERLVADQSIMCLADALAIWLIRGNATDHCESYEFYLQAVLHIIARWLDDTGGGPYYDNLRGDGFCRTPLEWWEHEPDSHLATDEGRRFIVLPRLLREDSTVGIWNHPALSKETFEHVRFRRQAGHHIEFTLENN